MSRSFDPTLWKADPILSKRSITPPRSMTRESIEATAMFFATARGRIVQRNEELANLKGYILAANLLHSPDLPNLIKQIDGELAANSSSLETLASKYAAAFIAYSTALSGGGAASAGVGAGAAPSTASIFSKETYTIDISSRASSSGTGAASDTAPEVQIVHYRINHDISVDKARSTVFGVSTIDMVGADTTTSDVASASESNSRSGASKAPKKPILLHPLEIDLLVRAVCDLVKTPGIKSVLLDIFDKDQKTEFGKLKFDEYGKAETHTVVLYKQQNTAGMQIFVTDPNNSTFSSHLDHPIFKACINSALSATDSSHLWVDIVASKKPIKIYTSPESTSLGPNPNQFRDCEDIAIKIASWFNRTDVTISQTLSFESKDSSIVDLPIIQALTNADDTNKDLTSSHKIYPLRVKQSSNIDAVLQIAAFEKTLKTQKDVLTTIKRSDLSMKVKKAHTDLIEASKDLPSVEHNVFITQLQDLVDHNLRELISGSELGTLHNSTAAASDILLAGALGHDSGEY